MRFVDFDVFVGPAAAELRDINLRYRSFVEAVVAELRVARLQAPWRKLYFEFYVVDCRPRWLTPNPKLGLSSAGLTVPIPDPALASVQGEAIRPILAASIAALRDQVLARSGWDEPDFWSIIERVGAHRGPYQQRLKPVRDRRTKVLYHLTYEWNEAGTMLYLDAHGGIDDRDRLGRSEVGSFPGQWEVLAGVVPSRIRLRPDGVELLDHQGTVVRAIPRPWPCPPPA